MQLADRKWTADPHRHLGGELWWRLISHAGVLEHVGPATARTAVTVLEMLTKVISAEELFALIAFTKLMDVVQVLHTRIPIRRICELCTAVAACVGVRAFREYATLRRLGSWRFRGAWGSAHGRLGGGMESVFE